MFVTGSINNGHHHPESLKSCKRRIAMTNVAARPKNRPGNAIIAYCSIQAGSPP